MNEVELRCDFRALLLLLAPGPLAHKGTARPTPNTRATRIGDTGSNGLVTCIGCSTGVAGKTGDKTIGAS